MMAMAAIAFDRPNEQEQERFSLIRVALDNPVQWEKVLTKGFSNSEIFRLTTPTGSYAVRSWPNDKASFDKVMFWESLQRSHAFCPFPRIIPWGKPGEEKSILRLYENRLWSLSEWVLGQSLQESDLSLERIVELAGVLGALHSASLSLLETHSQTYSSVSRNQQDQESYGCSQTLRERLQFLESITGDWEQSVRASDFYRKYGLIAPSLKCLSKIHSNKSSWRGRLQQGGRILRRQHWIVRDLWFENILVCPVDPKVFIVDLGAARFDWPGLDFTRLFGSILGAMNSQPCDSPEARKGWECAYARYICQHPQHAIESLQECIDLDEISGCLSVAQWIQWIDKGIVRVSCQEDAWRVASRLKQLCQSVVPDSEGQF